MEELSLQLLTLLVEDDEFHGILAVFVSPGDEFAIDDTKIIEPWRFVRKVDPLFN